MLRFLRISHLAVIDSVEVEFDPGLNVLTGETGAGKSILVEAVGLLLGGRASGDLVRTGEDAATIEAIFESGGEEIARPPRDHRPGAQPRLHQRRACDGRRPEGTVGAAHRASRPARAPDAARSGHASGVLDAFGAARAARAPVARRLRRACATAADALGATAAPRVAEREARQDLLDVSARRARPGRTCGRSAGERRGRELAAPAGAGERRARRAAVRRRATRRSTRATTRPGGARAASGGASASWPRSIRSSSRTSTPATASSRSSKTSPCFCGATPTASMPRPARLQQVEERLALLERLKRKYGPTLGDVIARRDALRQRAGRDSQRGDEPDGRARSASTRPRATGIWRRRGRCRRRAGARRRPFARAARGAARPSWRWSARASRCASPTTGDAESRSWTRGRDRRGRVLRLAESGRRPAPACPDRVGRRAVAHHAGHQDADVRRAARGGERRSRAARRRRARPDLRRGRRRHRRARRGRRRPQASGARRRRSRCCASRTCRRSRRYADTHFQIEKRVGAVAARARPSGRLDAARRGSTSWRG